MTANRSSNQEMQPLGNVSKAVTLPKKAKEWREQAYADCQFAELEDRQIFPTKNKKIILVYPSGRLTQGNGYNDAQFIKYLEIHHLTNEGCKTYFVKEDYHDGMHFSQDYRTGAKAPHINSIRLQRDGATQLITYDAFRVELYQDIDFVGVRLQETLPNNHGSKLAGDNDVQS